MKQGRSMGCSSAAVDARHDPLIRSRASPAIIYRRYLASIAARELGFVLDGMTKAYARELRAQSRRRDFNPFFEMWCSSQTENIDITSCVIEGDWAHLDAREGRRRLFVRMRFVSNGWRVNAEDYAASVVATA
jgi:hypothetical protein